MAAETVITVTVVDQDKKAVPGVRVEVTTEGKTFSSAITDENGHAVLSALPSAPYEIRAVKEGFEPAEKTAMDLQLIELTLVPAIHRESVEVKATASAVGQQSPANEVPVQTAKELPSRPATVSDALPLVPGVARLPGGGLQISGSGEHRSALLVNSADVTDPATGQFGLTVPIDSVETLSVFQAPFLAQYGQFSAGLISVETRRGGEKWKWELNDPFPEFFIRSWQLRGLRTATPRLNLEGPLIPSKLYFSEGFEYEIRRTPVFTLPFPDNLKKEHGINSFAQLDWVVSDKQLVTATVHVAPHRLDFVNLNYFNPRPTAPDASTHNYTGTLADRLTIGGGMLENTLSVTRFDAGVWGQGTQDLILAPQGNSGNYFAQLSRGASRTGWSVSYAFAPASGMGTHNVKVGSYVAGSSEAGQVAEHPIDIVNAANQLMERLTFSGGRPFQESDRQYAFFAQDQWIVSPYLAMDFGLRAESQEVSEALRLAPRAGIVWNPFTRAGTVIRAGMGLFYDRVPLNVYSFSQYPNEIITMFNAAGQVSAGPFLYKNGLGEVTVRRPFVFGAPVPGNFSPRSITWSTQVEQPLTSHLTIRAGYMQNTSYGLVIMNLEPPDRVTNTGARLLSGGGQSRYRQLEVAARVRLGGGQLMFSYVRSRARATILLSRVSWRKSQ